MVHLGGPDLGLKLDPKGRHWETLPAPGKPEAVASELMGTEAHFYVPSVQSHTCPTHKLEILNAASLAPPSSHPHMVCRRKTHKIMCRMTWGRKGGWVRKNGNAPRNRGISKIRDNTVASWTPTGQIWRDLNITMNDDHNPLGEIRTGGFTHIQIKHVILLYVRERGKLL